MRVQSDHWRVLLEFCENHKEIITNKFSGPRVRADLAKKWEELTALLNSLGLGEKTTDEWKKTLIDWKSKTKAKAASIANYQGGTGGGPAPNIVLTSFEERLLALIGKFALQGTTGVREVGIPTITLGQAGPTRVLSIPGPSKRPAKPLMSVVPPKKLVYIKVPKGSCQQLPTSYLMTGETQGIQQKITIPAPQVASLLEAEEESTAEPEQEVASAPEEEYTADTQPAIPISTTGLEGSSQRDRGTRRRNCHPQQLQQLHKMNKDILEVQSN